MVHLLKHMVFALVLAVSTPVLADGAKAQKVVEGFHGVLAEVVGIGGYAEREAYLAEHTAVVFDTSRIAAISLGRTWRTLPEDRRASFIELLTDLITATYADRFDNDSGQTFATDVVAPVKDGFVVRTRLLRPGEEDVSLDYFLRDGKIFNVVADGVSDLSLRRADYNSIIKSEGFDALLEHMRDKILIAQESE